MLNSALYIYKYLDIYRGITSIIFHLIITAFLLKKPSVLVNIINIIVLDISGLYIFNMYV